MNTKEYILTCLAEELGESLTELVTTFSAVPSNARLTDDKFSLIPQHATHLDLKAFFLEMADVRGCAELLLYHDVFDKQTLAIFSELTPVAGFDDKISIEQLTLLILETHKATTKLLRFGIDHIHPVYKTTGRLVLFRLTSRLHELCVRLSMTYGLQNEYSHVSFDAKRAKVMKYLNQRIKEGGIQK
jgi:hypothetical protein